MEAVGTGIFFAHHAHRFVLSAAHVLWRMKDERLLIGDTHLVPLNERFFAATSDDVDLGFVPLNDAQAAALRDARFLSDDDANVSDRPESEADGHRFYVVGFRADMNAPDGAPSSVVSAGAAYLAFAASDERYRELGVSPDNNLVLSFDRTILYSDARTADSEEPPEGMSGSGAWQFTRSPDTDRLVALLIEHSDKRHAINTARLRPLMDALRTYCELR